MRRREWTEEEKEVVRRWCMALRSNKATAPTALEVANQLRRGAHSVRMMAREMGCNLPRREWTMREVAILREWYSSTRDECSLEELAKRLGRTRDALVNQALVRGFTRRHYAENAPESEVMRLRSWSHAGWSLNEMSRTMSVPRHVIRRWLVSLGLPIPQRWHRTQRATQKAWQTRRRQAHEDGYADLTEVVRERKRVQAYFRWPGAENAHECDILDALAHGPASVDVVLERMGHRSVRVRRRLMDLLERGMVSMEWENLAHGRRKIYRLAVDTLPYNEHRRRDLEKGERIPSVSQRDRDYLVMHRVGL